MASTSRHGTLVKKPWTAVDDAQLSKLVNMGGFTLTQIGQEMNRSPSVIRDKIAGLGLTLEKPKYWRIEDENKLRKFMKVPGMTEEEIANRMKRPIHIIGRHVKRLKEDESGEDPIPILPRLKYKPWTSEDEAKLLKLTKEGRMTIKQIAKHIGRSESTTYWNMKRLGLDRVKLNKKNAMDPKSWSVPEELLHLSDLELDEDDLLDFFDMMDEDTTGPTHSTEDISKVNDDHNLTFEELLHHLEHDCEDEDIWSRRGLLNPGEPPHYDEDVWWDE